MRSDYGTIVTPTNIVIRYRLRDANVPRYKVCVTKEMERRLGIELSIAADDCYGIQFAEIIRVLSVEA